jgi:hypothetical protein
MRFFTVEDESITPGFPILPDDGLVQIGVWYKVPLKGAVQHSIENKRLLRGDLSLNAEGVVVLSLELTSTADKALIVWHRLDPYGSPRGEAWGGNTLLRRRIELREKRRMYDVGEEVWSILSANESLILMHLLSKEIPASFWYRFWIGRKFEHYWQPSGKAIVFDGNDAYWSKTQEGNG